ncbi:hypothetical protein [Psychroserpens sp. SPM9]|uniref:hypothetical protein n=1 Tax=Psychroserpens sp. SPM9 TaxID=2975598 RepID=UPI0021A468F3|nr:hypothetical protein [Psychroserpens sp. SPM9]MDG5492439.1 hypothetical protein [Psychroserpens sp. SPM9]
MKLLPFSFNTYNSHKTVAQIFESFDHLMLDINSNYSYETEKSNNTFWFQEEDFKTYSKTYYYKTKVRMKASGTKTEVYATSVVSSAKLYFLFFLVSQLFVIILFTEKYTLLIAFGILVMYLIVLNFNKNEYTKPKDDLIKILN